MVKDLLGKAVHNASEHHTVINIKTAVMQRKTTMEDAIEAVYNMQEGYRENVARQIETSQKLIISTDKVVKGKDEIERIMMNVSLQQASSGAIPPPTL